jgi:hypothetical protein
MITTSTQSTKQIKITNKFKELPDPTMKQALDF